MNRGIAERAGSALAWRAGQLLGVQGLAFLRTLVLARLLVPDDFGLVAIGVAAIGSLMAVTDLGVAPALVQRDEVDRRHYDSAWTIAVLRGAAVSSVLMLAAPLVAELFSEPRSEPIVRILCLRPFIESLASIKLMALQRRLDFRSIALARVPPVAIDLAVAISLAPRLGVWALVAGTLAGSAARTVLSYVVAPYRPKLRLVTQAALALARFGRWVFARGILTVLSGMLIQVVVSRRLGADALGLYFLAGKLAYLPYEVASQVVGEVAFSLYSRLQRDRDQLTRAFRAVTTALYAALTPVYGAIIALAPSIVNDLLGQKWSGTEDVIRILAVVGLVGILGDAATPLFLGVGRPAYPFLTGLVQTAIIAAFIGPLSGAYGLPGAASAWLPAIGASQIVAAGMAMRVLDRPFRGMGFRLAAIGAAACLGAGCAFAVDSSIEGLAGLILALAASGGVAGAVLWSLDRMFRLGIVAAVPKAFPQAAPLVRRLGLGG